MKASPSIEYYSEVSEEGEEEMEEQEAEQDEEINATKDAVRKESKQISTQ